ncbi:MAG: alpha-glucosidase [Dorea sp.]
MQKKWWHDKVAYQIYPKSFKDSNGDGIGDLRGIISKLDYLQELGIDILWISPIYQSPFVDQGYDISDYYSIAEEFGTMEEFDELLGEAEKRGIKIVMDLVINHCSDKHQWFQKALNDPQGEYADYFYFVKGKDGNSPSNYRSYFGGSTWEQVPGTDKYYLHMFAKEQPDLNWENPVVKEKLFEMINWWLDKGIAGFRVDAIINIKKDLEFPDFEPDGPDGLASCIHMVESVDGVGDMLEELKKKTFAQYDAFTVGEVFNMKEDELEEFVGEDGHFSTMFDFEPHVLTMDGRNWYEANDVEFKSWKQAIIQSQLKGIDKVYLANIIENHDEPRGASRYLPVHAQNDEGKKMLGTVSVLLRGLPFLYQGQEIGMVNCRMNDFSEYDDINTKDQYQVALDAGCSVQKALDACYKFSRDNARTPMQWDDTANAGFTTGKPWLRCNDNYKEINVASQINDKNSVLSYYKELIRLRKNELYKDALVYGDFTPVYEENANVLGYVRGGDVHKIMVLANFGKDTEELTLDYNVKEILLANKEREACEKTITLTPCETVVLLLS